MVAINYFMLFNTIIIMTKRQKTIRHLVTCYDRHALTLNKKECYYWWQQIQKGLKIVNIKPWY